MNVYGEYNKRGYAIFDENGVQIYRAGNSPFDSQQDVTGFDCALGIAEILECCINTATEIAEEIGGIVLFVEESED
jgi:hypothetical protein